MIKMFIICILTIGCEYQEDAKNLNQENISNYSLSNDEQLKTIYRKFDEYQNDFPNAINIYPEEVERFIDPVIVDVREREEFEVSMIKNSITKSEFLANKKEFQDKVIIVYCTIGYRSGVFSQKLLLDGFESYNLKGGVLLWSHFGLKFYKNGALTNRVHIYAKEWAHLHSDYEAVYGIQK
jgi:rhodanese-related sulfurtransferase